MKVSLTLAASAFVVLCGGCERFGKFKGGGDGGTGGGGSSSFTHASSVNVYNCYTDESAMVYRAPVASNEWQLIDGTGASTTVSPDVCPDESDWAIPVALPDGQDHVIRILFKGVNDNCNDQKAASPDCRYENKTYTGDDGAGIVDWAPGS